MNSAMIGNDVWFIDFPSDKAGLVAYLDDLRQRLIGLWPLRRTLMKGE